MADEVRVGDAVRFNRDIDDRIYFVPKGTPGIVVSENGRPGEVLVRWKTGQEWFEDVRNLDVIGGGRNESTNAAPRESAETG